LNLSNEKLLSKFAFKFNLYRLHPTQGAEAGLPKAMRSLGLLLEKGEGVAAPDYPAAPGWFRRAADAGIWEVANNLTDMYAVGRGVTRSKRRAMKWCRKAAEKCSADACLRLAVRMYTDSPHARAAGHVREAAAVAASAGVAGGMEGHDVPRDVLTGVVHWLRKGGQDPVATLDAIRREALEGGKYCYNEGCEAAGHLKDFKRCQQCRIARYCSPACQNQDWTTGGHKLTCGKARWAVADLPQRGNAHRHFTSAAAAAAAGVSSPADSFPD
jgi:TPR repeat protein